MVAEMVNDENYQTLMFSEWHGVGNYDDLPLARWRPSGAGLPMFLQRVFDQFFGAMTDLESYYYYQPSTLMREDEALQKKEPTCTIRTSLWTKRAACSPVGTSSGRSFFTSSSRLRTGHCMFAVRVQNGTARSTAGVGTGYARGATSNRGRRISSTTSVGFQQWGRRCLAVRRIAVAGEGSARDGSACCPDRTSAPRRYRVVALLAEQDSPVDTLVVLCDNGDCPESLREDTLPRGVWARWVPTETFEGRPVSVGNGVEVQRGDPQASICWVGFSNRRLRRFEPSMDEERLWTRLVAHWPTEVKRPGLVRTPVHVFDVVRCRPYGGRPDRPVVRVREERYRHACTGRAVFRDLIGGSFLEEVSGAAVFRARRFSGTARRRVEGGLVFVSVSRRSTT